MKLAYHSDSPARIIRKMIELAQPKTGDILGDIGCGPGRVLRIASGEYGLVSIGYEMNPRLARKAMENIRKWGLEHLATVIPGDVFDQDLSRLDIIILYLSKYGMQYLKEKLADELKDDSRIISHWYKFEGVKPKSVHYITAWQFWFPPEIFRRPVRVYDGKSLRARAP